MPRQSPAKDQALRTKMVQAVRATGTFGAAAEVAQMPLSKFRSLLARNPDLAQELSDAMQLAVSGLEAEAYRRAIGAGEGFYNAEGYPIKVYDAAGNEIFPAAVKSDQLLKFMLQHRKPGTYNQPVNINLGLKQGALTPEYLQSMTDEQLAKIASMSSSDLELLQSGALTIDGELVDPMPVSLPPPAKTSKAPRYEEPDDGPRGEEDDL